MKISYLWAKRYYKPEYDIDDFARVNSMDDYNPRTVIKLMRALYSLRLQENYPEYFNVYDTWNEISY